MCASIRAQISVDEFRKDIGYAQQSQDRVLADRGEEVRCRICHALLQPCFTNRLLSKHDVSYYHCDNCGFLQTERPYRLDEAYAEAIAAEDVDLVRRNLRMMRILTCVLPATLDHDATFLDLAGGYGLLTRLMRDKWVGLFMVRQILRESLREGIRLERGAGYGHSSHRIRGA